MLVMRDSVTCWTECLFKACIHVIPPRHVVSLYEGEVPQLIARFGDRFPHPGAKHFTLTQIRLCDVMPECKLAILSVTYVEFSFH